MLGLTVKNPPELSASEPCCLSVSVKELVLLEQRKLHGHC